MSHVSGDPCRVHPPVGWDGRALRFDPSWRTETVVALARGIDAEGRFDRMPILADALQDAGCELSEVLDHCRVCERHESNCWVIGLALARVAPTPPADDSELLIRMERLQRMAEASRAEPLGRVPKEDTISLAAIVPLILLTLGAVGWLVFGPVPTSWTPTDRAVPNPFEPNAFTDSPEWQDAKGRIDAAMRPSRGTSPARTGGGLPGP
jgi:hypothetical protein